jgi:disease resistance protein RPM1
LSDLDGKARRIFIQHPNGNLQPIVDSSKLRSFLLIQGELLLPSIESALSNLRLLRVLCLKGSQIEILPRIVFELFNLHCLDLSNTKVKLIPKSLGKLKLLQTLDLGLTLVEKLPQEVTKLSKLRHLYVLSSHNYQERQYDCFSGVTVPAMICGLKDLQILSYIEANDELILRLGSLQMLRKLSLFNVKRSHIADLWVSIAQIPFLTNLGIVARDKDEVLNLQTINPLRGLEKLYLKGSWREVFFPPYLVSSIS